MTAVAAVAAVAGAAGAVARRPGGTLVIRPGATGAAGVALVATTRIDGGVAAVAVAFVAGAAGALIGGRSTGAASGVVRRTGPTLGVAW